MIAEKPININEEYRKMILQGEPIIDSMQDLVVISIQSYKEFEKAKRNAEYLKKLDESIQNHKNGDTISFTMDELKEMESEDWQPSEKILDFERKHGIQRSGKFLNE